MNPSDYGVAELRCTDASVQKGMLFKTVTAVNNSPAADGHFSILLRNKEIAPGIRVSDVEMLAFKRLTFTGNQVTQLIYNYDEDSAPY